MKLNQVVKFMTAIIICELVGAVGSVFTMPAITTWYATLVKPTFNPPNWIFAPVWTTLFALMGAAAFLVWRKGIRRHDVKIALMIFFIQLILNMFWSIIFFGLHLPNGAFIEIIFLLTAILVTIIFFARVSKLAAWLLMPYLFWVAFASLLNYSIYRLNI